MQAGAVLLDAPRHLLHDLLRRHLDAHQGLTLLLLRHDGVVVDVAGFQQSFAELLREGEV